MLVSSVDLVSNLKSNGKKKRMKKTYFMEENFIFIWSNPLYKGIIDTIRKQMKCPNTGSFSSNHLNCFKQIYSFDDIIQRNSYISQKRTYVVKTIIQQGFFALNRHCVINN